MTKLDQNLINKSGSNFETAYRNPITLNDSIQMFKQQHKCTWPQLLERNETRFHVSDAHIKRLRNEKLYNLCPSPEIIIRAIKSRRIYGQCM